MLKLATLQSVARNCAGIFLLLSRPFAAIPELCHQLFDTNSDVKHEPNFNELNLMHGPDTICFEVQEQLYSGA